MENKDIQQMYRTLLTEFIIKQANLKEYDKTLETSNLNIVAIDKQDMDEYQYVSSSILKYFYIRNDIYTQNLTKQEEDFIQEKVVNKDNELDEKTEEIIKNSYKRVIVKNKEEAEKNTVIKFYGPPSNRFMVEENSIVIGFRYNEFNKEDLNNKQWEELHTKQENLIYNVINEIKNTFNKNTNDELVIIKYNQFSVKPRKK